MVIAVALFLVALVGFGLYSVYAVHHLNEYGYSGDASQQMIRTYLGCASLIILLAIAGVIAGIMTS
ncbi:hypothetical protein HY374_00300 [Candidatus Berkelbacteria bacterium]|nr:hypothetical protein [Candidatus Berkelbacteria bacterium]